VVGKRGLIRFVNDRPWTVVNPGDRDPNPSPNSMALDHLAERS
jgi:hypothetical protein